MRSLAALPLLLTSTSALPELSISKRDRHTGGQTDLSARGVPARSRLTPRQDGFIETNIFDVLAWSSGGAYYANLTVGTPPQPQTVILDTGSSDLYFDASSASTCEDPPTATQACEGGTFDSSKSSTYREVHAAPAFNTSFGDGSTALGPYGSDVVGIGHVLISPVQFGVATTVDSTTGFSLGLMGLGYSNNEAVTSQRNFYQNMPEVLQDAGEINSRLYSVFLNGANAGSGTILFGGIDTSKYTGPLATVNFLPQFYDGQELPLNFITTVTAANITLGGQTAQLWSGGSPGVEAYNRDDPALPVLLDTGSTAWSIPQRYFLNYIEPNFDFVDRSGICSCEYAKSGPSLSLEFGGKVTITVTPDQFIVPIIDPTTRRPQRYDNKGNEACIFLLAPDTSGQPFLTLGDAILRSMYVVFDLDNGQGSIAQAATNPGSPNIVTVQAGPTGVAAAVSGVNTAPANTVKAPGEVQSGTVAYSVATAATSIGTATGAGAVPANAQVVGGSGTGSSSESSSAAATVLSIPGADFTALGVAAIWTAGIALGASLML